MLTILDITELPADDVHITFSPAAAVIGTCIHIHLYLNLNIFHAASTCKP